MEVFAKHKNTLFCNFSQYVKFKNHKYADDVRIVGSLWVPRNKVYYVDSSGKLIIHEFEGE